MRTATDLRIRIGDRWESALAELLSWARDVTFLLNALHPREYSVTIDTAALPLTVEIGRGGRPVSIELIRAVKQNSPNGRVLSGGAVEWDSVPSGGVRLHFFSALESSTRYEAVIMVRE